MLPAICMIAAIGKNRELGKDNRLLWHIPEDMAYFRETTKGKTVIMGRKTFESIGHPLPKRTNIVVTSNHNFSTAGVTVCNSVEQAVKAAIGTTTDQVFIIGGALVYQQALGLVDTLYLTLVDAKFEADSFFPEYHQVFDLVSCRDSKNDQFSYRFCVFKRKPQS